MPVDFTGLDKAIDGISAEVDRLRAERAELLAALKSVMSDIDNGVLVRNVSRDGEPNWSLEMLSFVRRLQECQHAIAKAEGRA